MDHVVTRRLPACHNCSQRSLLQNFGGKRLVAKSWLSCCSVCCKTVSATQNTPLGQRSPGDWSRFFKLWRRRPCSAMSEACYRLAELVASYSPSTDIISSTFEHGWLPLLVLFWQRIPVQRPSDDRAHKFLRKPAGSRVWALGSPSKRSADYLRAMASLALSQRDARPQRLWEYSKQSLRRWSPSYLTSLIDRQALLERHVCHATMWFWSHRCSKIPCTTSLQKEWPETLSSVSMRETLTCRN